MSVAALGLAGTLIAASANTAPAHPADQGPALRAQGISQNYHLGGTPRSDHYKVTTSPSAEQTIGTLAALDHVVLRPTAHPVGTMAAEHPQRQPEP